VPESPPPRHRLVRSRRRPLARAWARLSTGATRVGAASLLLRFGVVSAVLVTGLGLVLAVALKDTVENRALAQAEETAARVTRLAVEAQLEQTDFEQGEVAPDRFSALDSTLRGVAADGQVLRVKIFDRRGTLLYSDDPELIGERAFSDSLAEALAGGTVSEIEDEGHEESERGMGAMLEVYVPVSMDVPGHGEQVVGAFEMYLPYAPIADGVADDVRQLLWVLGLGLVSLWAGLFQLMTTASRRLRQHARTSHWLAQHDALTGLPNRSLFAETTATAIRTAAAEGTGAAVLHIDLDRFKEVNDTLGHHIGDELVRAIGARLREQCDGAATVARLGGDEFAVLLPVVTDTTAAAEVAADLLARLRTPVVIDDLSLEIDASVGVAVYPDHGHTGGALLQCADVALHHAKERHDGVVTYRREFDVHTPARLALFGQLRRAIEDGQLVLHYQPKVDVARGRVVGVEALVRWEHPEHGLLPPADFIPLAEQTGLIRPMTLHLLDLALQDCTTWRAMGLDLSVAVNLSARSLLDADLPQSVRDLLDRHAVPACALELEITETTAMVDPGRAMTVLAELRALGVRLSVDDYGTGHASLSYLHQLPVDTLKIDKSFVQTMDSNTNEATIVRSTIDLARNLGLEVVAEGVETEAAWHALSRLGCDAAQGFWLARPGAAADVPRTVGDLERRLVTVPALEACGSAA
jgi:diguanylate cyclase (GGDEF)-like protein